MTSPSLIAATATSNAVQLTNGHRFAGVAITERYRAGVWQPGSIVADPLQRLTRGLGYS